MSNKFSRSHRLIALVFATGLSVIANSQNVGIGTNTPDASAILDVQSTTKGFRLPNQTALQRINITNPANGLMVYDTDLRQMVYRANGRWLAIDSANSFWSRVGTGMKSRFPKVFINTNPYLDGDDFSLSVGGSVALFNGIAGTASELAHLIIADTLPFSTNPTGISVQKISNLAGKNFVSLLVEGDKARARLQAVLRNGAAGASNPEIIFEDGGKVGIGNSIGAKEINASLHLFGNQRIEGINGSGASLFLHGNSDNYTMGSQILFHYNPTQNNNINAINGKQWYSIEQNNRTGNSPEDANDCLAISSGKYVPVGGTSKYVGLSLSTDGRVGIRKYPSNANFDIKVDINGPVRITGGLLLQSIGESYGKILTSSSNGTATWRNPEKITLDQQLVDGQSAIEFRNGGAYRGSFGWSQASGRYFLYDGGTNSNPLVIKDGRMGVQREPATNTFEVGGTASKSSAGDWLANSDIRLKKDIQPLQGALQKLQQLNGITYHWNDTKTGTNRPAEIQMGFTAQNIQQVFPQLVSADAQGYLQTAYGTYDALYVEAIKELKAEVDKLRKELDEMKKQKNK